VNAIGSPSFAITFDSVEMRRCLATPLASRAIGVVYKSGQENLSHYFDCVYSQACDAIVHTDVSSALAL
jgi:hypothetical protein